jgi:hypothetical protein
MELHFQLALSAARDNKERPTAENPKANPGYKTLLRKMNLRSSCVAKPPRQSELPVSGLSRPSAEGRDLPDADSPGFVVLNGGFRAENRSLIGQSRKKADIPRSLLFVFPRRLQSLTRRPEGEPRTRSRSRYSLSGDAILREAFEKAQRQTLALSDDLLLSRRVRSARRG